MNRRELLKMIATLTGGAVIGGEFFLAGCNNPDSISLEFKPEDIAYLDEVAETILPKTQSAGAKEAKVGAFMAVYVKDCYNANDQKRFREAMKNIDKACDKTHGTSFMKASPEQRTELLIRIDKERSEYQKTKKQEDPPHYFQAMKQLTILGYFTSKEGRQTATRFIPVPAKFIGDYDYKKGDKIITGLD